VAVEKLSLGNFTNEIRSQVIECSFVVGRWNSLKLLLWFLFQHPQAITLIENWLAQGQ
jgi:hypothetical protein